MNSGTRARSVRLMGLGGMTILAFGLLLWARLVLVANPPRTAIADPKVDAHARAAAADLAAQRQASKANAAKRRATPEAPASANAPASAQANGTD